MSSTEQKNVVQPFLDSCYTFGILPTVLCGAFDNFSLATDDSLFGQLGPTYNLGRRLRGSSDPIEEARLLLPSLRNARSVTRVSPILLRLCTDSAVYSGNQAVCRFSEALLSHRWGIYVRGTKAYMHAKSHIEKIAGLMAPGSYSRSERLRRSYRRIGHKDDSAYLRQAADAIDYLRKSRGNHRTTDKTRRWCASNRDATGFRVRYRRDSEAIADFRAFNPDAIHSAETPPDSGQKLFTVKSKTGNRFYYYKVGDHHIFKICSKYPKRTTLYSEGRSDSDQKIKRERESKPQSEAFFLSSRDMDDLRFLLQAASQVKLYMARRINDSRSVACLTELRTAQKKMFEVYHDVLRICGEKWSLRNKLGVYFDVLQWRYLAWKSGDTFYNHSYIMKQKVEAKGLTDLPDQNYLLMVLKRLPMDMAIDLLGIYKASIYPEVDPFEVVAQQKKLHYSRHVTDWKPGTPEHERFEDTKAYMWYFAVRVIHNRNKTWPGKIRNGAEAKGWHKTYKASGIPGNSWRDAHDVDLTGAVPVADITNEQYIRQQDSACAPPHASEYASFDAMKRAPRRHRRKLLYAIQEPDLPDLPDILRKLNRIGAQLPDGYIGRVDVELPFSTDIVTGARCERHKDAPRPFYAASPPWGCVLSYFDGITRDFLSNVPQSMLGKSTKQKFSDLKTASRAGLGAVQDFYMSDDKAKYSPKMDPQSQQLPADFFAELFAIPGIKAFGPVMYHCQLFYRVCGHLVDYGANGTDREGMRGASNTWLEVVAQGLSTRLCRERGWLKGKSLFLSFIDDGLRRFSIGTKNRSTMEVLKVANSVIDDVIFGLKVLGRELSWDKTFISTTMFVMLNEVIYDGSHFSSGLKSFCTAGDVEMKEVMSAADYEQLHFGKMRGSHGVGVPLDLCHYVYLFECLMSHYLMGLNLQDNHNMGEFEYRLFCITPLALGGAGFRTSLQLGCNEVAGTTKEGIGVLQRLALDRVLLAPCVEALLTQELEPLGPIDFMREPEQFHVYSPRIKTQRLAAEVRRHLYRVSSNELSRKYIVRDEQGMQILASLGRAMMAIGDVGAEEIRLLYASSPVAFIDEFVQKLASSTTLAELLGKRTISIVRRQVRRDLQYSASVFRLRCGSQQLVSELMMDPRLIFMVPELVR